MARYKMYNYNQTKLIPISFDKYVFERLRKVFPLPKPRICHAIYMPYKGSKVMSAEPYALIGHIWMCGGVRLGNHRIYPEADPEEWRFVCRASLARAAEFHSWPFTIANEGTITGD